ncbi:unnamed protein product [Cunninghamella blakesleeana]
MSEQPSNEINKAMLYFHYIPMDVLPQVAISYFVVVAILFSYRIFKNKDGKWLYILPGTAIAEMLGYIFRLLCRTETTLMKYVVMNLFLLLSPNALALVNYKALAKIVQEKTAPSSASNSMDNGTNPLSSSPKMSNKQHNNDNDASSSSKDPFWLRPKFITWFFFASDIFSFLLQGSGGGLQATGKNDLGQTIVLFGLGIQLFFLACFTVIALIVYRRPSFDYQLIDIRTMMAIPSPKKKIMVCLFVTTGLLYVRSIYRFAEYATGFDGPIARREWAFLVFDFEFIGACFIVYYCIYIGNYLPNNEFILRSYEKDNSAISLSDLYR